MSSSLFYFASPNSAVSGLFVTTGALEIPIDNGARSFEETPFIPKKQTDARNGKINHTEKYMASFLFLSPADTGV